ncbi:MAG TPA: OmpA family protein [Kofleriaceae bacterium]|nr:OmpA family protein [Kofleriaceae bacterium]
MSGQGEPSGSVVYPKLPVPSNRNASEAKVKGFNQDDGYSKPKIAAAVALVAAIGGAVGYLLAPDKGKELAAAKKEAAAQQTAAKTEKDRADGIAKQVDVLTKDKTELEKQLSDMTAKAGEMEKKAQAANEAAQKKLKNAIGDEDGSVSTEGEEIHLKLVDKVLFAVGDDQLTDKGKTVLDKVAKALKDIPDKQIWVQGHTDDSPIIVPPPPKKDPKKKGKDKEPELVPFRFKSNWELSAARALQVVHYLQDHAKVDPTKLAALAFGEYRPVAKNNKAANRRIEIVLYPHRAVIERAKK